MFAKEIMRAVERKRDETVKFVRELVKTPSPTGEEKDVATILKQKMEAVGYSQVLVDPVGNIFGIIKGQGNGRSLLYNGHMDHVPPGGMEAPYSAKIQNGAEFGVEGQVIYGRGTSDMKGALGAMVMAGSVLKDLDLTLRGDLIVTGTVLEEDLGNVGPPSLIEIDKLKPDAALVGECTNLDLAHGNRGVVRTMLATYGKSCHVSVQDRGVNALYQMAKIIEKIQETNKALPSHPILGKASWAICKIAVTPNVANVVPDRCEVEIDTRNIPDFTPETITDEQQRIIDELTKENSKFKAEVSLIEREAVTWTGNKVKVKPIALPFYIEPNHWLVGVGKESIKQVLGREARLKIWGFTTECYCFTERNIPTIGFGPGEERFAHSSNEVISIEDLITATKVYAVLAANICNLER